MDPGWADQPLHRSARLRQFAVAGQQYAHTSAVPLAYLGGTPRLMGLLDEFTTPRTPASLGPLDAATEHFLATLLKVGILVAAERPDPVHALRPSTAAAAGLYLYPTNSCNLRCTYCYAVSGPDAGPRLSAEHALIAVDDFFAGLGDQVRSVTLRFHGGGEPTTNFGVMRAAWSQFARHAQERGLHAGVSTITNGTFGPSVLRELSQPQWQVLVSYDGPRQSIQRPTAVDRDSRDRVVANLRALAAAGKHVTTRATLTRAGLASMVELVDDAAEIGIATVQVEPASVVGRGSDLRDGAPDALEFAETFLAAFEHGLRVGVALTTAAWSHARVGDGRYCGAIQGARGLTPDGFISACTEVVDGANPDDPFLVGRLAGLRLELWPTRTSALADRTGYRLASCAQCFMVDTCAGGCASRARAQCGSPWERDLTNCQISQHVNPLMMAAIADGRLVPDDGWQPVIAELQPGQSVLADVAGRVVALVPPFARRAWNSDPRRRPLFAGPGGSSSFFHLPDEEAGSGDLWARSRQGLAGS